MREGKENLNVLVVDDSAVVRELLNKILTRASGFSVSTAADPLIAMQKMWRARPDVIVLDLEMPRMDGMTFLRKIMREDPIPVVICSGNAGPGTKTAIRALEEGAIEIITKPQLGVRAFLEESATLIIDAIRGASEARIKTRKQSHFEGEIIFPEKKLSADVILPSAQKTVPKMSSEMVVAIGASAGGTEALHLLLRGLPPDSPGIVVVQHMPEGFTAAFAQRLNEECPVSVKEAESGDRLESGRVLIAPGNRHTLVQRVGFSYFIEVRDGPLVSRHRPSVDVLFRSVAQSAGPNAIGVIMTGMGDDGAIGLLEMREAGAHTIAQDEASCVVFGMPKEAIALGGAKEVLPLSSIGRMILRLAVNNNPKRRR